MATQTRRWYREPWVWLLIALPMSAVIGGMITLYLAISSNDGLVVDDYYKRGKTIDLVLARDRVAASLQLQAILRIESQSGLASATLNSVKPERPEHLRLLLLHPARAGEDQDVVLDAVGDGVYSGHVKPVAQSNWHVQLEADDWRLYGRAQLPRSAPFTLMPQALPKPENPAGR